MKNLIFDKKDLISKGWSDDKKYCVLDKNGNKFLLRISPKEQYDKKKMEFENMQKLSNLHIPMCEPIEIGVCDEGVYSLHSWIDGQDAEAVLPSFSDERIYNYGIEAGKILKIIHSVPAPEGIEDWENFFNRKMDRKIEAYRNCEFKYDHGETFIDFINENRYLLKKRPRTYQHGDYHIGNMMIGENGQLYIIDFDRNDYGDPWEEFNRIVWCVQAAPLFASGMVDGYFECKVPVKFWKLLALYISSNTLSSLPWAVSFGEREIAVMKKQAEDILEWYDNMRNPVPKWYLERPK